MYDFIRSEQGHYPVVLMCRILGVGPSAYYAYRSGGSYRQRPSSKLVETAIVEAFTAHRRRYGVRRLIPELRDLGHPAGHYKIRKVLHKYGLKAIQPRSFVPRTTDSRHPYPISPNLLLDGSAG